VHIINITDSKSEKVPKSDSEILTPKEYSNPVDELYINFEKERIRQEHKEHCFP